MVESNRPFSVICVTGPTASGKSAVAVQLAKAIGGEIINADSVQVYSGFDIGSGKLEDAEMGGIPHHLISHLGVSDQYSTGRFRKEALRLIAEISERGLIPIVVGGTGLYVRALFSEFMGVLHAGFPEVLFDYVKRSRTKKNFELWCRSMLQVLDPEALERIGENDFVRIQRALHLFLTLGVPNSLCRRILNQSAPKLDGLIFILDEDNKSLYEKINQRVLEMWEKGWFEEVEKIIADNPARNASEFPGLRAIGYRHIYSAICQLKNLEPFDKSFLINAIQRDTRRFAKRQKTWWRHQPEAMGWIPLHDSEENTSLYKKENELSSDDSNKNSFIENFSSVTVNSMTEISKIFIKSGVAGLRGKRNFTDDPSSFDLGSVEKSANNVIFKKIFLKHN